MHVPGGPRAARISQRSSRWRRVLFLFGVGSNGSVHTALRAAHPPPRIDRKPLQGPLHLESSPPNIAGSSQNGEISIEGQHARGFGNPLRPTPDLTCHDEPLGLLPRFTKPPLYEQDVSTFPRRHHLLLISLPQPHWHSQRQSTAATDQNPADDDETPGEPAPTARLHHPPPEGPAAGSSCPPS